MCLICDGKTHEEALAEMHELIGKHGFTMSGIEPSPDHPGWIYTVGLAEHDHPELSVLGLPVDASYRILDALSRHVFRGGRFAPGETVELGGVRFHIQAVDQRLWEGNMFNQWWNYYDWRDEHDPDAPDVEPEALELVVCAGQTVLWGDDAEPFVS